MSELVELEKKRKGGVPRGNVTARLLEEAQAIDQEDAVAAGMAGFVGRALVQATLPYREPDRALPFWGRGMGDAMLIIKPGYEVDPAHPHDPTKARSVGYPYGTIPRLLLAWLSTEAVRTKEPRIVLGDTLAEFMNSIGVTAHSGGKNGSITRLREMMKRLFAADMAIVQSGAGQDFRSGKFTVADEMNLWWSKQRPDQAGLWQSTVTLSSRFFNEVTQHPVPVDLRALRALRQSPMSIDLYCWLTYRMFALRKPTTVPWEALRVQFGSGAERDRKFREILKRSLGQVLEVYPHAKVEPTQSGLLLSPSLTSVPRVSKPDF